MIETVSIEAVFVVKEYMFFIFAAEYDIVEREYQRKETPYGREEANLYCN